VGLSYYEVNKKKSKYYPICDGIIIIIIIRYEIGIAPQFSLKVSLPYRTFPAFHGVSRFVSVLTDGPLLQVGVLARFSNPSRDFPFFESSFSHLHASVPGLSECFISVFSDKFVCTI
jgi:hypothetical protein